MTDPIEKIKGKEARLNAMAFSRRNTGLDEDFIDLLLLAEKISKHDTDIQAISSKASPEDRVKITAIQVKLRQIHESLANLEAIGKEIGVDVKKLRRLMDNKINKTKDFRQKFEELDQKLGEKESLAKISPYLDDFND